MKRPTGMSLFSDWNVLVQRLECPKRPTGMSYFINFVNFIMHAEALIYKG